MNNDDEVDIDEIEQIVSFSGGGLFMMYISFDYIKSVVLVVYTVSLF